MQEESNEMIVWITKNSLELIEMHGVSVLENLVALVVVVGVLWYLVRRIGANRKASAIVLSSWIVWLSYRVLLDYNLAFDEVSRLALDTFHSTQICVHSFAIMIVSWMALIAPFAYDFVALSHNVYSSLTTVQRVAIAGGLIFAYGSLKAYNTVVSHADKVKQIMFHLSFILIGPVIWFSLLYLPQDWIGYVSQAVLTWIPFGLSCNAFYKCSIIRVQKNPAASRVSSSKKTYLSKLREVISKGTPKKLSSKTSHTLKRAQNRMANFLSFWSCWPLLILLSSVCKSVDDGVNDRMLQTEPILVIFSVWCLHWKGSAIFYTILAPLSAALILSVETASKYIWKRTVAVRKLWMLKWFFSLTSWLMSSKIIMLGFGGVLLLIFLRVMFSFLGVVGATLKLAIIIGAAADSFRVVDLQLLDTYEQKLSFWILLQILDVLTEIPVWGFMIRLWEPLLLAVVLVVGSDVLRFLFAFVKSIGSRLWSCVRVKKRRRVPVVKSGGDTEQPKQGGCCRTAESASNSESSCAESDRAAHQKHSARQVWRDCFVGIRVKCCAQVVPSGPAYNH